jgi:formylglycine-generating enzyme required for sulfatase activity
MPGSSKVSWVRQGAASGSGAVYWPLVLLVVGILGAEIWLRSQEMNWNVLRIWTMAQVGLYGGPAMVPIRGGTFQRGSSDCAADNSSDECPQRRVAIQSFEMGQYEVTFDEYTAFVLGMDDVELPNDQPGLGPRLAARDQRELGRCKSLRRMAFQGDRKTLPAADGG